MKIQEKFDEIKVVLSMSGLPLAVRSYAGHPEDLSEFAKEYDQIRKDPVRKQAFDDELVLDFLSRLGTTNELRGADGFDAGFELGRIGKLLKTDYENLPAGEKHPERRLGEALVAEELALLWKPITSDEAQSEFEAANSLAYQVEGSADAGDQRLATLTSEDRWNLIGMQLCGDAAALFQEIAEADGASYLMKHTAREYGVDMTIRQLGILHGMEHDPVKKGMIQAKAIALSYKSLRAAHEAWLDKDSKDWDDPSLKDWLDPDPNTAMTKKGDRMGRLYGFIVLANKRHDALMNGDMDNVMRLAMPREDRGSRVLPVIKAAGGSLIRLSVDLVNKNTSGGFQVKALTRQAYEKNQKQREARVERNSSHGTIVTDESQPRREDLAPKESVFTAAYVGKHRWTSKTRNTELYPFANLVFLDKDLVPDPHVTERAKHRERRK